MVTAEGDLVYLPREDETIGSTPPAVMAVSEGLITAVNVSGLSFTNINFRYSTWMSPSLGPDGRSGSLHP